MNDTSIKVFIALGAIAHIVFNTGYNKAKYQQTISVAELNQKKHELGKFILSLTCWTE